MLAWESFMFSSREVLSRAASRFASTSLCNDSLTFAYMTDSLSYAPRIELGSTCAPNGLSRHIHAYLRQHLKSV